MRFGIDGKPISAKDAEVLTRRCRHDLLEFIDDVVGDMVSRKAVEQGNTILHEGTPYESLSSPAPGR